jgi:hypothetical protein
MTRIRKSYLWTLLAVVIAVPSILSAEDSATIVTAHKDCVGCYATVDNDAEYILLTTDYVAWTRKGNRTVLRYTWADKGISVYQYGPYRKVNMALSWKGDNLTWSTHDSEGKPTVVEYQRVASIPDLLRIEPITPKAASTPPPSLVSDIETKLVEYFQEEQAMRKRFFAMTKGRLDDTTLLKPKVREFHKKVEAVDDRNREYLRSLLQDHGWPSIYSRAPNALEAAFFIALHSGDLQIMRTAEAALRDSHKREHAMMSDRLRLITNEPLLYGIQASVNHLGKPYIPILADRAVVNANRESIGEPPIEILEKRGVLIDEIESPETQHAE